MKINVIFLSFILLMSNITILQAQSPATEEEFLQDTFRYVELFDSKNALFSLNSLDYISYFGEKAVPALLKGLEHSSPQVRSLSAMAFSKIPDKRAIEPLIKLLSDTSAIDLQVLSDDGKRTHSSYDEKVYAVCDNAWRTLQIITGKKFGELNPKNENVNKIVIQRWQDWWSKEKDIWEITLPKKFSNMLDEKAKYPIPDFACYLEGRTICLDPGHGGDADKIGYKRGPSGNRESESNLKLCRYLKDFLKQCGAQVLMTRDSDKFVSLSDRPNIAKLNNADIFLSIHHNWSPRYTAQATTIWYHDNPDYNPASMDVARYIFDEVTKQIPMNELDRTMGLKSDYFIYDKAGFAVLRELSPEIPGVLCELSYFSNLETELKLRDSEFLKKEAYGVFLGLAKYFYAGVPYWKIQDISSINQSNSLVPIELSKNQNPKEEFNIPSDTSLQFTIKIYDGLEDRQEWGCHLARIFAKHLIVELNQKTIPFVYQERTGILTFTTPSLSSGKHSLQLWIIGLNKNHNHPKIIYLSAKK